MTASDLTATAAAANLLTEIENLYIPTGKAVTQYLQYQRNGAKLVEILTHLKEEYRGVPQEQFNRNVAKCIEVGVTHGFLERKGSVFVTPSPNTDQKGGNNPEVQPEDRCRRRRRRSCSRRRRRRCCCRRRRRRGCRRRRR